MTWSSDEEICCIHWSCFSAWNQVALTRLVALVLKLCSETCASDFIQNRNFSISFSLVRTGQNHLCFRMRMQQSVPLLNFNCFDDFTAFNPWLQFIALFQYDCVCVMQFIFYQHFIFQNLQTLIHACDKRCETDWCCRKKTTSNNEHLTPAACPKISNYC